MYTYMYIKTLSLQFSKIEQSLAASCVQHCSILSKILFSIVTPDCDII